VELQPRPTQPRVLEQVPAVAAALHRELPRFDLQQVGGAQRDRQLGAAAPRAVVAARQEEPVGAGGEVGLVRRPELGDPRWVGSAHDVLLSTATGTGAGVVWCAGASPSRWSAAAAGPPAARNGARTRSAAAAYPGSASTASIAAPTCAALARVNRSRMPAPAGEPSGWVLPHRRAAAVRRQPVVSQDTSSSCIVAGAATSTECSCSGTSVTVQSSSWSRSSAPTPTRSDSLP
jgi:hypothetical protein